MPDKDRDISIARPVSGAIPAESYSISNLLSFGKPAVNGISASSEASAKDALATIKRVSSLSYDLASSESDIRREEHKAMIDKLSSINSSIMAATPSKKEKQIVPDKLSDISMLLTVMNRDLSLILRSNAGQNAEQNTKQNAQAPASQDNGSFLSNIAGSTLEGYKNVVRSPVGGFNGIMNFGGQSPRGRTPTRMGGGRLGLITTGATLAIDRGMSGFSAPRSAELEAPEAPRPRGITAPAAAIPVAPAISAAIPAPAIPAPAVPIAPVASVPSSNQTRGITPSADGGRRVITGVRAGVRETVIKARDKAKDTFGWAGKNRLRLDVGGNFLIPLALAGPKAYDIATSEEMTREQRIVEGSAVAGGAAQGIGAGFIGTGASLLAGAGLAALGVASAPVLAVAAPLVGIAAALGSSVLMGDTGEEIGRAIGEMMVKSDDPFRSLVGDSGVGSRTTPRRGAMVAGRGPRRGPPPSMDRIDINQREVAEGISTVKDPLRISNQLGSLSDGIERGAREITRSVEYIPPESVMAPPINIGMNLRQTNTELDMDRIRREAAPTPIVVSAPNNSSMVVSNTTNQTTRPPAKHEDLSSRLYAGSS